MSFFFFFYKSLKSFEKCRNGCYFLPTGVRWPLKIGIMEKIHCVRTPKCHRDVQCDNQWFYAKTKFGRILLGMFSLNFTHKIHRDCEFRRPAVFWSCLNIALTFSRWKNYEYFKNARFCFVLFGILLVYIIFFLTEIHFCLVRRYRLAARYRFPAVFVLLISSVHNTIWKQWK